MVEASPSVPGRHIAKDIHDLPEIDASVTLDKQSFNLKEKITLVKVPVLQIQEFSRKVSQAEILSELNDEKCRVNHRLIDCTVLVQ